jgi:biopolymer transport protein TolR
MGGAAPTPSGKGGKKALDAQINLVPFIDLLSCCLSFLLITAVWTQLARMDVTQKGQGAAGASDEKPPEPTVSLTLYIDKDGYTFAKSTGESTPIPMKGDEYDYAKLADILKDAKSAYPDKNDISVKSDDAVIYNKIIRTMDIVLSAKFPDIGLSDKGGAQ